MGEDLRVAVVTGGHGFDGIAFHDLWRALPGCTCDVQPLEDWSSDVARHGHRYDVVVFYNMHTMAPAAAPGGQRTRRAVDSLARGPGIVVLHHAILAFKGDPVWDDIVGMTERTIAGYRHDEALRVRIADGSHPITRGMEAFDIVDETYDFRDVDGTASRVLLTVDHPGSMSTQAWTRRHGDAPVFNLVLGHDGQAWANPGFRRVLERGIRWAAGRLTD